MAEHKAVPKLVQIFRRTKEKYRAFRKKVLLKQIAREIRENNSINRATDDLLGLKTRAPAAQFRHKKMNAEVEALADAGGLPKKNAMLHYGVRIAKGIRHKAAVDLVKVRKLEQKANALRKKQGLK